MINVLRRAEGKEGTNPQPTAVTPRMEKGLSSCPHWRSKKPAKTGRLGSGDGGARPHLGLTDTCTCLGDPEQVGGANGWGARAGHRHTCSRTHTTVPSQQKS